MHLATAVLAVLVAGCGQTIQTTEEPEPNHDSSSCGQRAWAYLEALRTAAACTPGVSQCTAQRPLVVIGPGTPPGLCWTAYVGLLEPEHAATLDPLIAQYTEAGCTIGFCPGPGPHATECTRNDRGAYTCGGI